MEFVDERGGEVLALAIAAVGRLGPKEMRGPYGQRMLGQTQAKIVETVTDHGPLTVSELAATLGLNYQNTRRMLPVLEARGLIHKGHCPIKAAQVWAARPFSLQTEAPTLTEPVAIPAPEPDPAKAKRHPPPTRTPEQNLNLSPEQRAQEHVELMRYIHGWEDPPAVTPHPSGGSPRPR